MHGDLHLRNICLVDGKPLLFDCIEFSDDIATIDILYDLAFLLMDLDHRGHRDLANLVLNRYLDLTAEDDGLALMPLFLSLRAVIRAHVTATMAAHGWGGGRSGGRFRRGAALSRRGRGGAGAGAGAAGRDRRAQRQRQVEPRRRARARSRPAARGAACCAATSCASCASAPRRRARCRSKPIAPRSAPRSTASSRERAAAALRAGYAAVIDAVALREEERRAFAAVAAAAGVPFTGLWLEAPAPTMMARLGTRRGDASDASGEVLRQQLVARPGHRSGGSRIDAGGGPDATLAASAAGPAPLTRQLLSGVPPRRFCLMIDRVATI